MKHTSQPSSLNLIQHSLRQSIHRLLMNIVGQNDTPTRIQSGNELVHTVANQSRIIVLIVLCVDTRADDMVPEIGHSTQNNVIDGKVRRPHVLGSNTGDLLQRILKLGHLRHNAIVIKRGKVGVAPTAFTLLANYNHLR